MLPVFSLLLQVPPPAPTVPEWILHHAPLLSLTIALLMPFALWALNRRTALRDKAREAEQATFKAWQQRVDEKLGSVMAEDDIRGEVTRLGQQIGENQGKLKLLHDRAEEVSNSLNMRVASLEQHGANLAQLPQQVQRLNTDHAVLASEVRALAGSLDKLGEKQEKHFRELMEAVSNLSYTRGQLSNRPPTN